jgi:hypothetical protein
MVNSMAFGQEYNLNILIESGVAERLNKNSKADEIYKTILNVLNNDRYVRMCSLYYCKSKSKLICLSKGKTVTAYLWILTFA